MEQINALEEIFLKKGLISIKTQYEIKDKSSLSMVYTPGVGACCMKIKEDPNQVYSLTAAESTIFVLSNGSTFGENYLSVSPSFMMPELELICFAYKSLSNLDAFPMVFNSNVIKNSEDVAWMVEHISPCVAGIELYEVDESFYKDKFDKLDAVKAVIITPNVRCELKKALSKFKHSNYLVNLIIGLVVRIRTKLRIFGTIDNEFINRVVKI